MERGMNLEALAEEEDEDPWETEDEPVDDEQGDGGVRRGEPNKFDSLCDGVRGHLSLVHNAMAELIEVKDELLKHGLPPNVLTKVALSSTKVFRAVSDLHMPITELLRLVRIYSSPWEEKSTALKKLHQDYEAKKSQLNIAVKRLQLIDAQSKRMAHDKKLMNWEKLYCKMTTAKGHGRRWKFLINDFKKKAKQGSEALYRYINSMGSDSETEDDTKDIETQMQQLTQSEYMHTDQMLSEEESDEDEEEVEDLESESKATAESRVGQMSEAAVTFVQPVMVDKTVWTQEPEYKRQLHIRVYKPEGLKETQLRCRISCGDQTYKTKELDTPEKKAEEPTDPQPPPPATDTQHPGRGRGRGLLMRGGRKGGTGRPQAARSSTIKEEPPKKEKPPFEECVFSMPDDHPRGAWVPDRRAPVRPDHIQVAVHQGTDSNMIAMATIDMDDLDTLDLPSVYLPSPDGADESLMMKARARDDDMEGISPRSRDEAINKAAPLSFPLYSVDSGHSSLVHVPCGHIPLVCFWAKTLKPNRFHKNTEAESITDIVLSETGFDLKKVSREELHPEQVERSVSAASFGTSQPQEPQEETVSRADYDRLMRTHTEEMEMLQEEYEVRLQELAENLHQMQQMHQIQELRLTQQKRDFPKSPPPSAESPQRPRSSQPSSHSSHMESTPESVHTEVIAAQHKTQSKRQHSAKNFRVGHRLPNWGENLPAKFLDRLRHFEERAEQHLRETAAKHGQITSDMLQKRLAGEYKLAADDNTDDLYNAMQDVSLPAVFLPSKGGRDLRIFNPRAHQYFHAPGSSGARLTQPPSMVQLPPLPQSNLSVVNLFDLSKNFRGGGQEALMEQYMAQQEASRPESAGGARSSSIHSPAHTISRETLAMTTGPANHRQAELD